MYVELLDAARVDGAGLITTFTRVMLPLSIPAFVVVGIFQFTNIWNDFLFGITVVPNPASQPVTIALNNLSGTFSVDWNVVMAGAVLAGAAHRHHLHPAGPLLHPGHSGRGR